MFRLRRRRGDVRTIVTAVLVALVALEQICSAGPAPATQPSPTATKPWSPPRPPAAAQQQAEREAMVATQIENPTDDRRAVKDQAVLAAMRQVPRHAFVPQDLRPEAYRDTPLPIGHGQTISQPYIVALMTELLELKPHAKVLEIGMGSGYQAAVLSHMTPNVYTIEIIAKLADRAGKSLAEQEYRDVKWRAGDGYFGWAEHAPFDAIIVTCAAGHLPPPLWEQLKPGGRIVIPVGGPYETQRLVVVSKTAEGKRRSQTIIPVAFVPMTGEMSRRK